MYQVKDRSVRLLIYLKYDGRCAYCGCKLDKLRFTIDHIEPKFRGSSDEELAKYGRKRGECEISNYNPSCHSCNCSKSTFKLETWREEIAKKYDRLLRDNSSFKLLDRFGLIKRKTKVTFYFEKPKKDGKRITIF